MSKYKIFISQFLTMELGNKISKIQNKNYKKLEAKATRENLNLK